MESTTKALTDDTPAMAVLEAVAERDGIDPSELDTPLYSAIDPDALDCLLDAGADVTVTFEYENHTVTASGDGRVVVDGDRHRGAGP